MKKEKLKMACAALLLAMLLAGCGSALSGKLRGEGPKTVSVFAGSVVKPAMEEAARIFERKTGIEVELNFGGSGTMLSQMMVAQKGDLYVPVFQDFMRQARSKGVVNSKEETIAYLIPAIGVRRGNPLRIHSLDDLGRSGIKVGIADPDTVAIGILSRKILSRLDQEKQGMRSAIQRNIVVHAKNAEDLTSLLLLDNVDAIINWNIYARWHPKEIEMIELQPQLVPRTGHISAAVTRFARDPEAAQALVDFLASARGRKIFQKHGYEIRKIKN